MPLLTLTLSLPPGVTLSNPDAARLYDRLHVHALTYLCNTTQSHPSVHLTEGDCTGSLTVDFTQHASNEPTCDCDDDFEDDDDEFLDESDENNFDDESEDAEEDICDGCGNLYSECDCSEVDGPNNS